MTANIKPSDWDELWAGLEQALERVGSLSVNATRHLLNMADGLSNQGDWDRAWRALDISCH